MAKVDPEFKRFLIINDKINSGQEVKDEDLHFWFGYAPQIDQEKIDKYLKSEEGLKMNPDDVYAGIAEASKAIQTDPRYKDQVLKTAQDAEAGRLSDKITQGANVVLGGLDIANSAAQIRASNKAVARSKRPGRPSVPQRDIYLQQALRSTENNINDPARAVAASKQEINNQYLNDLQTAKTASTGQAGAFGAYAQLAANRRNNAAAQLSPIQDQIRREQQSRYDNLLGQRLDETQRMFQNQAELYGQDLNQYNYDQQAAAHLGATGRENLRNSLYNLGNVAGNYFGQAYAKRRYDRLRNQMSMYGDNAANMAVKAHQNLDGYLSTMNSDDTPQYWEQAY